MGRTVKRSNHGLVGLDLSAVGRGNGLGWMGWEVTKTYHARVVALWMGWDRMDWAGTVITQTWDMGLDGKQHHRSAHTFRHLPASAMQ